MLVRKAVALSWRSGALTGGARIQQWVGCADLVVSMLEEMYVYIYIGNYLCWSLDSSGLFRHKWKLDWDDSTKNGGPRYDQYGLKKQQLQSLVAGICGENRGSSNCSGAAAGEEKKGKIGAVIGAAAARPNAADAGSKPGKLDRGIERGGSPVIATFLQLQRVFDPHYPVLSVDEVIEEVVAFTLHFNGLAVFCTHSQLIDHALLFEDYKVLNLIVCSLLAPVSHINTITSNRGRFLYAIGIGEIINIASRIFHFITTT
ncbi:hypothetical protein F0562_025747 [Nyssa sinensis]|uniref:Uncharacterized protein n=1 Tax=Nyssa sinensis TaxID=561372 RepID=A0A5J5B757_9ASTE|nr:hypothetical protein F0562_025747 [Nyssa sinensis]